MLSFLIVFAGLAALVGGCGKKDKGKIVIGFSQVGAESGWRMAETKSVKAEADKRGIQLLFDDGQASQSNKIRALRNFITRRVDAIILAPKVEAGWDSVLKEAKAAGIPVILLDRNVDAADKSLYVTYIGPDCVEEGRIAGRWLADKLNGKGNIIELEGTPGSAPAIARKNGFHEIIEKHPDIKIIESQSGDFLRTQGKEVMEALLKNAKAKNIRIDALYAHNDDMAIGAIQAIEETGLKPGKDILVVSIDAVKGAFEAMTAGTLNCTVECNPLLGPYAFDAAEKAIRGEAQEKWIKVPTRFFEQSQAAALIDGRLY
jgi:simple sugar transport system substrate-binding protein